MLPLHGIKVIDLSSVIFGPYCAQWFADLGADVIKLEAPEGDSTRQTGPGHEPGMAALFLGSNRGKRGLVLDLKTAEGRAALDRLLETADVLLHSIRPQKLASLGLEPKALLARHPRLVFAGLHGFGEAGPYGGRPAYDDVIQGMSGIADLMLQSTGTPRYMPTIIADKVSGLTAGLAILAALVRRQTTGKGGFVEIPMFETMVAFNFVEHYYGHHFDPPKGPLGYPRVMAPWRRPLATADGYLCMMAYTDAHWRGFFTVAEAAHHHRRPALCQHRHPHHPYRRHLRPCRGTGRAPAPPPTGCQCWKTPRCPAPRSSASTRWKPTRTWWPPASSPASKPPAANCATPACRCCSMANVRRSARRRGWASTRARCCLMPDFRMTTLRR